MSIAFVQDYERFMPLAETVLEEESMLGSLQKGKEEHVHKKTRSAFKALAVGVAVGAVCIIGLIYMFGWMRRRKDREKNRERILRACAGSRAGDTIFVSVASYRDPEVAHTLRSMFARAKCPSRIFVGLCVQNSADDIDPVSEYVRLTAKWNDPFSLTDHIRTLKIPHVRARGPCHARHQIQSLLYKGEKYVLQIDSHTMFAQGWDNFLIDDLHRAANQRTVLTTIPQIYTFDERHGDMTRHAAEPTFTFLSHIDEDLIPHFMARTCVGKPNRPFPVVSWFPGFSFSTGDIYREVPYTIEMADLQNGEDFYMGARMWTRGWNFRSPTRMPLYTTFDDSYRATLCKDFSHDDERRLARMTALRHMRATLSDRSGGVMGPNHLGSVRTLSSFWLMCGIAPLTRNATPACFAGTTNEADVDEIMAKYGSVTDFSSVIRAAGGHL